MAKTGRVAKKYDRYQWCFPDGRTARLSQMTEHELREALADSLDFLEKVDLLSDKLAFFITKSRGGKRL